MATIAMQYIVDFAITHIPGVSGGGQATIAVPPVRFLGVPIEGDLRTYYMALLVCAVIALFMLNVGRTAFGRALAAIREKDYAAEIIGIDTFKYKLLAFWTSSFIGGVVGSVLVVCYLRSVSPDQFHHRSVDPDSRHGDRGRTWQRAWQLLRRGPGIVRTDRAEQF